MFAQRLEAAADEAAVTARVEHRALPQTGANGSFSAVSRAALMMPGRSSGDGLFVFA